MEFVGRKRILAVPADQTVVHGRVNKHPGVGHDLHAGLGFPDLGRHEERTGACDQTAAEYRFVLQDTGVHPRFSRAGERMEKQFPIVFYGRVCRTI